MPIQYPTTTAAAAASGMEPQSLPTCFATVSLGFGAPASSSSSAIYTLPEKLSALAAAGFDAIELAMPDLASYGAELLGGPVQPDDYATLVEVARAAREQVRLRGLRVAMLQPFGHFEGWPRQQGQERTGSGSVRREDAFRRAEGWLRIAETVGAEMLQVGSSDAPGIAGATDAEIAEDLGELADLAREKYGGIKIAYENWCWATRAPGWRDVWKVVKMADRQNLGLCLDTFQSAGGEWADPTTRSGLVERNGSAPMVDGEREARWKRSLEDLVREVPPHKIYILQISDAYKADPPLEDDGRGEDDEATTMQRPRARWSGGQRPLPCGHGGYLPVRAFTEAVLKTGFWGYLSIEVFDARARDRFPDMTEYAREGMKALTALLEG